MKVQGKVGQWKLLQEHLSGWSRKRTKNHSLNVSIKKGL